MPRLLGGRDMYECGRIATLMSPAGTGATHPPVSLNVDAELTLSIGIADDPQEISIDTKAANVVWAGPAAGLAAVPTWRGIVAADLPGTFAGFANPTAQVGLAVVNGVLTTAMRSDAAPPLSQAITPTWTNLHTFQAGWLLTGGTGDLNGLDLILDADADSYLHALADDVIEFVLAGGSGQLTIEIGGMDDFTFTTNSFNVLSNSYITMNDDCWIGLGAAAGRIIFDNLATDQVQIAAADLYLPTGLGVIHADGVTAGMVLRANGTRYIPSAATSTIPFAPTARGDMIAADATPAWARLALGGATGSIVTRNATDPIWSGYYLAGTAGQTYTFGTTGGTIPTAAGTLTVATANAISAAGVITHAVTTTAVGAASTIMATDANGRTQVDGMGIGTAAVADNSIVVADDTWIGLGAAGGRIVFDSTTDPDNVSFYDCAVGIGIAGSMDAMLRVACSNYSSCINIDTYDDGAEYSKTRLRKSDTDTVGTVIETDDGDSLGAHGFYGVNTTPEFSLGASIIVTQEGASGAQVPCKMRLATYTNALQNLGILLDSAGRVGVNLLGGLAAQLHIDQANAGGAMPVLLLNQGDTSEGFIDFVGTDRGVIAAGNSVASVRVELNGTVYRLALYADA